MAVRSDPAHPSSTRSGSVVVHPGIGCNPDVSRPGAVDDRCETKEGTMKRILIATDGSPAALQAVELGLELAEEHDSQVTFVHVAPAADVLPSGGFALAGPVSVPHELGEPDQEALDEALALAEQRGIPALRRLLVGSAATQIVAYADEIDADLIVVGSRGLGAVEGALLGSVSRKILRDANRPVLVVRETPARLAA